MQMPRAFVFRIDEDGSVEWVDERPDQTVESIREMLTGRQVAVLVKMDPPKLDWAARQVHITTHSEVVLSPELQRLTDAEGAS